MTHAPDCEFTAKSPPSTGHETSHDVVATTRLCVPRSDTEVAPGFEKMHPPLYQSVAVRELQVFPTLREAGSKSENF